MQIVNRAVRHGVWLAPIGALVLAAGLTIATGAQAQGGLEAIKGGLAGAGKSSGLQQQTGSQTNNLESMVGSLIGSLLSVVGLLLLVYLIYGGFKYMTAGGDSKGVQEATSIIRNAVIGLIIIVLSYYIADWIMRQLTTAATGTTSTPATSPP